MVCVCAQGFPVPSRCLVSVYITILEDIHTYLYDVESIYRLSFLKGDSCFVSKLQANSKNAKTRTACFLEPVGSVRPKIPSTDDVRGFRTLVGDSPALMCPAQGFPVPLYR